VLGPLEARVGDSALELGGRRQRAVLAALVLRAGEAVPVERLADDVWGETPPPSAPHTLEAYVSRLRQALSPHELALERRGRAYALELDGAVLDAAQFREVVDEAGRAAGAGDDRRVAELSEQALALWRGPPLAELSLEGDAQMELSRLEELRLRTLELGFGAALALGNHDQVVGEVQQAVDENPYRERFVSQLMLALYRSGRQAEALEVYERTRRRLDEDLGLVPSPELRDLSGRIVRQDAELLHAGPVAGSAPPPAAESRRRTRRLAGAAAAAAVVGVGLVLAWAVGAGGTSAGDGPPRVALVIPLELEAGREDTFGTPFVEGLLRVARDRQLETETVAWEDFTDDPLRPDAAGARRLAGWLRDGDFDLVLIAGGAGGDVLAPELRRSPETTFVWLDTCCIGEDRWPVAAPNELAVSFDDDKSGYLVGYLAGLVEARLGRRDRSVVSAIGGVDWVPAVKALVEGFERGVREALPDVEVLVDYSNTFLQQDVCARIANRQIDAGSTIVFPAAGTCSLGALRVAGARGVWGIGVDGDRSLLGPHILASTVKRLDRAVELAVQWYLQGTMPRGEQVVLGLDDDAVGIAGLSPELPPEIRERIGRIAELLTAAETLAP
jgi:basic membrane lipoprotein Med (substrate-binding protein (PBP1-ABC) superfamily)/DNA-binding SARP family transcriptional activator